jgi:hypothetical protein
MAEASKPQKERRKAPRVQLSVAFAETDPRTTTPAANLSEAGAYILTGKRPAIGTIVDVCFAVLPEAPALFEARGRVVRHGPDGIGVEFVDLGEPQRDLVRQLLEREREMGHRTARSRRRTWTL